MNKMAHLPVCSPSSITILDFSFSEFAQHNHVVVIVLTNICIFVKDVDIFCCIEQMNLTNTSLMSLYSPKLGIVFVHEKHISILWMNNMLQTYICLTNKSLKGKSKAGFKTSRIACVEHNSHS